MLIELHIKNYALIDDAILEFGPGLNVITGETGAGKSIITKAMEFITGSRTSPTVIKSSAEYALVEASFDISSISSLQENLFGWGIDIDDEILIVRRTISRENRKSRAWVNNHPVTIRQLQEISRSLLSFAGQHEQQMLLNPDNHLKLLDTFGNCHRELERVQRIYKEITTLNENYNLLSSKINRLQRRAQDLNELHKKLADIDPKPGEGSKLKQELHRLRHAAFLHEKALEAYSTLYENTPCVHDMIASVEKNLMEIKKVDPEVENIAELVYQANTLISEASMELRKYYQKVVFDPHLLTGLEDRLNQLKKLAQLINCSIDELHLAKEHIERELEDIFNLETEKKALSKKIQNLWSEYYSLAQQLSKKRQHSGKSLAEQVSQKLAELDIPRARFRVEFITQDEPSASGTERALFLFSANPGEPLKPLNEVASGGELSRIFLVLKSLIGKSMPGGILIFDEIDTGLGAGTAKRVGMMLKELSNQYQIICVTHQAQIAAMGLHHFHVEKYVHEKHTKIEVKKLTVEDRIAELSRMLTGIEDAPDIRKHAEMLLQNRSQ